MVYNNYRIKSFKHIELRNRFLQGYARSYLQLCLS